MDTLIAVIIVFFITLTTANTTYKNEDDKGNSEKPEIKLFYESMCPGCRRFDSTYFAKLVSTLGPNLRIQTYPYGKASTTVNYNGTTEFTCQHGPAECFGNTLHACALDILPEQDQALLFNACLMKPERPLNGSDDVSANQCGKQMGIDVKPIIDCAEGARGVELLRNIGEETVKANFTSLPHLLINGVLWTGEHKDLIRDVCSAFKNPPEACKNANKV